MLKGTVRISYQKRILLESSSFEAKKGQITTIVGYSGCGKSTILKALQRLNNFVSDYSIDGQDVDSNTDLSAYLISVFQKPSFIEDLTIKEQIAFLYQTESQDMYKWAKKLTIIDCLDKYPRQLSGGQQIRVALLIGLLKNAPYMLLDEPTASLDKENKQAVIRVLQEYANLGNCIILSTHDSYIYDKANVVYVFENKKLIKQKDDFLQESNCEITTKVKSRKKRKYYFSKLLNRKKTEHRYLTGFTILSLFLLVFTLQYGNIIIANQNNALSALSSKEIIVSISNSGIIDNSINPTTGAATLEKEDVEFLESIEGVEEVEWRFQTYSSETFFSLEYNNDDFEKIIESNTIIKFQNSQEISSSESYFQSVYYNQISYDTDVLYQFQEEGVYLSNEFASLFSEDLTSFEGATIEIDLFIPVYNSIGKVYSMIEGTPFYVEMDSIIKGRVTLEIAGILTGSNMGIETIYSNPIYVSQETLSKYIAENQRDEEIITYVKTIDEDSSISVIKSLDPFEGYERVVVETGPWEPSLYTIICESVVDVPEVTEILNEAGLSAYSSWSEVSSLYDMEENNNSIVSIFLAICAVVILIVNIGIKANNRKDEKSYSQFLFDQLYSKQEIRMIKIRKHMYFFFCRTIQAIISISCFITFLRYTTYLPIEINKITVLMIVTILFVLEVVVPLIVEGKIKNDKVN